MLPRTCAALATAVAIVVAGASVNAVAAPAPAARSAYKAVASLPTLTAQIAAAINATRAQRGLTRLHVSRRLRAAAAFHSYDMARHGFFSHNSWDGSSVAARLLRFYRPAGYRTYRVGEALLSYSPGVNAATAVSAWLSSPEHRAILLAGDFREIGISAVHVAAAAAPDGDETTLVTADFGARSH